MKENEASKQQAEQQLQELAYANKKLAAELDTAHTASRNASERDRKALRSLRVGLSNVEQAVAERAQRGYQQVGGWHAGVQKILDDKTPPPAPQQATRGWV